jgi:RNA polymerase sigma factor (sigma-70 family)
VHPSLSDIESIYRHRGADFFRLALARTGERESARDAVQEGFANAIRGLRSYRGAGSLEAWVARCVINAARDSHRHRRSPTGTEPEGGYAVALEDPPGDSEREAVRAAVAQLPQRQRDALFLRFYLDFDYATIAEILAIEVGTVSATLHAARAGLTHTLQEVQR